MKKLIVIFFGADIVSGAATIISFTKEFALVISIFLLIIFIAILLTTAILIILNFFLGTKDSVYARQVTRKHYDFNPLD